MLSTPIRSEGTLTAYDGTGPQFVSSSLAGNSAQLARGYDQDQTNVSGNLDFFLSGAASISVRGGMFRDNYMDTGVPTTTAVVWNTPSIGVGGVPWGRLVTGFSSQYGTDHNRAGTFQERPAVDPCAPRRSPP